MSSITGDPLTVPSAGAALPPVLGLSSSLPPSLSSSALPLPFSSPAPPAPALPSGPHPPSPLEPSSALISLVDQYAHRLHLPPPHARLTLTLIHSLVSQSLACPLPLHLNTSANHPPWIACCVFYSLLVLAPAPPLPPSSAVGPAPTSAPSFTHLLIAFALPLPVFLRHLDHLSSHLHEAVVGLGLPVPGVRERVDAFKASLLVRVALYKKYEKLYEAVIRDEVKAVEDARPPSLQPAAWSSAELFGCGWLLYLAVKAEVRKDDAHSLYVQLLAVASLVLAAALTERSRVSDAHPPTTNGTHEAQRLGSPTPADMQARLELSRRLVCSQGGEADAGLMAAVSAFYDEWLQRFVAELREAGAVTFRLHPCDLLSPASLPSNVTALGHFLDSLAPSDDAACHLDDRLFLLDLFSPPRTSDDDPRAANGRPAASHRRLFADVNGGGDSRAASPSPASQGEGASASPAPASMYGTPLRLTAGAQPHHAFSPALRGYGGGAAQASTRTPITRMMESVSWLTTTFSALSPAPSRALVAYFSTLSPNPLPPLQALVASLHAKVVIHDLSSLTPSSSSKRDLALRIYWLVVEQMTGEAKGSPSTAPPAWLVKRSFHSALLCICFELIFHAYRHALLCFPHTLATFQLSYFEYLRALDVALKWLPTLPSSLKAHLSDIAVSIIERHAWEKGEKAVEMMKDEAIRARVEREMRAALHSGSKPAGKDAERADAAPLTAPSSPMSPELYALLSLYRKLFSLCAERLSYLSSDLALSLSTRQQQATWALLTEALLVHPSLLFHRHVDSLLLCSLYTLAVKICHSPLDFRRIVHCYLARWEVQATPVIRAIEGLHPPATCDIIQLYNDVFIGTVKDFALGTLQPTLQAPLGSPGVAPLSPLPTRVRQGLNPHPNIYVSPMRGGAGGSQGVNGARVLSAVVGESPTKRLQEMNAMLEGRGRTGEGRTGLAMRMGGGMKALFREEGGAGKRSVERDGVEALLLASRVNGH